MTQERRKNKGNNDQYRDGIYVKSGTKRCKQDGGEAPYEFWPKLVSGD